MLVAGKINFHLVHDAGNGLKGQLLGPPASAAMVFLQIGGPARRRPLYGRKLSDQKRMGLKARVRVT
jgi:hypothetical protein